MYYCHKLNYQYPDRCDAHMISPKKADRVHLDEDYPYVRKDLPFKLLRVLYWLGLELIVFPLCRFTHGLRIYGRENLKKHKTVLENGAITISNHVFYWDYLCVLKAIRPRLSHFPAWKDNLGGTMGRFIRLSGGIPIPTGSTHSMIRFDKAIEELLEQGKWLHFFPEGSMWLFYPDIRPFKKAVFQYAARYDKPILPITMSFRPRRGIMRLFGKKPLIDLHVGEPLLPDKALPRTLAVKELQQKAYHVMQIMNGIHPGDPTYNTDQDPEHYQKTM